MRWVQFYDKDNTYVRISSLYQTRGVVSQFGGFAIVLFSKDYPDCQKDLWYDSKYMADSDYYRLKTLLGSDSSKMFYSFNDKEMTAIQMSRVVAFVSKIDEENKKYSLRFYVDADKYLELFYEDPDEALNDLNEVSHDLDRKGFLKHVMEYREGLKNNALTPQSTHNT